MRKNLLIAAALFGSAFGYAQCEDAIPVLNEDFSEFNITTMGAFPQFCWSASPGVPMLYTDETEDQSNQYVVYYNMNSAGIAGYLVSPALNTLNGNYELSFTTWKPASEEGEIAPDEMTVQVGTLTTANDYANFVSFGDPIQVTGDATVHSVVLPGSDAASFIAFKIIGTGAHNAVAIDDVVWTAVCEPVTVLDENFDNFMPGPETISQDCWSASPFAPGVPLVYVDGDGETGDYSATFYAAGSTDTAAYLVSPELSNIDGLHQLSFDAFKLGGPAPVTTIQVGTIAEAGDFASFAAVGEVLTVGEEVTSTVDLVFPASEHKFIAFKFLTNDTHGAAGVDNVVWEEVTAGVEDNLAAAFSIYPNPSEGVVSISREAAFTGNVSLYSITGAKVFETTMEASANTTEIDLSGLASGMYLVKIESGNATATKKLVIK